MKAGKLDTQCSIDVPLRAPSTFGGPLPPTDAQNGFRAVFGNVWACIEGLKGREFTAGDRKIGEITHRAEIRYQADVKPHMVLTRKRDGTRFDIVAALDPTGKRHCLYLTLREVPEWTASA